MSERRDAKRVVLPHEDLERFIDLFGDMNRRMCISRHPNICGGQEYVYIRVTKEELVQIVKDLDLVKKNDFWKYRYGRKGKRRKIRC